jgi:hypothetical protein
LHDRPSSSSNRVAISVIDASTEALPCSRPLRLRWPSRPQSARLDSSDRLE